MSYCDITWHQRPVPLVSGGMLIPAKFKSQLYQYLEQITAKQRNNLRASCDSNVILLLGEQHNLPWLPESLYLGKDERAPHLWLPTHVEPSVPIDLLDKAIAAQFGEKQFALSPENKQLIAMDTLSSLAEVTSTLASGEG